MNPGSHKPEVIAALAAALWGLFWIPLRIFEEQGLTAVVRSWEELVDGARQTIERARSYLDRAQARFRPFKSRTEAEVRAVADAVETTRREFNTYVNWWNREFAND